MISPRGERLQAQQAADQRGFARAIGSDDRDDLARPHIDVDLIENVAPADFECSLARAQDGVMRLQHHAATLQAAQSPETSTTACVVAEPLRRRGHLAVP